MGLNAAAKFWVAIAFACIIAALTAGVSAMDDGAVTTQEWLTIALAFMSAATVWLVPNQEKVL